MVYIRKSRSSRQQVVFQPHDKNDAYSWYGYNLYNPQLTFMYANNVTH